MKQIGGPLIGPGGAALPLSAAIEANGIVFVSGQLPLRNGAVVGTDIVEQTHLVLDLIAGILAQADLTLAHVTRCGVWLIDPADFPAFNQAYASRFAAPYPARATVISRLAVPGALVEIDAMAVRP